MDDHLEVALPAATARANSWGGPAVRSQLRALAEDARTRSGFDVCAIEVLRRDGLLELVTFTGGHEETAEVGNSFSMTHVSRVLDEGWRCGSFVYLQQDHMDADLAAAVRGYGYVPVLAESRDPQVWQPLDMFVAPLIDPSGRTRGLFHLDEPVTGRRPPADVLLAIAEHLQPSLQAALAMIEREELSRQSRLDATARNIVREAESCLTFPDLVATAQPELTAGFRARSVTMHIFDLVHEKLGPVDPVMGLPTALWPAIEAATRRAWRTHSVVIVEPGRLWGDDQFESQHVGDLTTFLGDQGADELLLIPLGAGLDALGVLVVVRDGREDRWTEHESAAALGVGRDLGRALLNVRTHAREQQLVAELQRLDQYRRELLATVSHELKNPLGVIVGHVELLESVPGLREAAATSLGALQRGAERLTGIVDDLLEFSHVEDGDKSPLASTTQVQLRVLLVDVVADAKLHAEQRKITLHIPAGTETRPVRGDSEGLRRVLANLVSNAIKYTRDGGSVHLELGEDGDDVIFTCADDGIGVSEADQELLFTEFFRSTNPEALAQPGTGLGLAIVHRIVARHGGTLRVDSALGRGTTVQVYLPGSALTPAAWVTR
ncbi:sensor histidine kinase [Nocardioides aurantiacus]|uniref:sensor histidine kinase n=1 Tax=Nocardioides aurantiacus TaxID=86796 RepID=UPI00147747D8|nr:HAMP domain-containing sensor histidine kinase [Nocardioides aurantiacus]